MFSIGLTQVVIALVLLCHILQSAITFTDTMGKLQELKSEGEIFYLRIQDDNQIDAVLNDPEKTKQMNALVSYAAAYPVDKYIADHGWDLQFDLNVRVDGLAREGDATFFVDTLQVTSNFFDTFRVSGDFETADVVEKFEQYHFGDGEVPIVMGHDFGRRFRAGDVLADQIGNVFRVVGFLDKNEFYVAPNEAYKAFYLNKSVIVPHNMIEKSLFSLETICFRTNRESDMENIIRESEKMGIIPLGYGSFSMQMELGETRILNEIMTMGTVMSLLFIFSSIGIISYIIRMIRNKMMEFSIHMIFGATKIHIIVRLAFQMIPIWLFRQLRHSQYLASRRLLSCPQCLASCTVQDCCFTQLRSLAACLLSE
jgi:hypothetical protein